MASTFVAGSLTGPRLLRTSIPGSSNLQRLPLGLQETTIVGKHQNALHKQFICHARGRGGGYRSFNNASDWGALFQSLAEMSKAFETGAPDYSAAGYGAQNFSGGPQGETDTADADYEVPVTVAVDVEESAEGYSLFMDVPGLQKTDVKIQVSPQQRSITISGERKRVEAERGQNASGNTFRRRYERRMGKFSRTLRLAKDLDVKTISARVEKGVLCVTAKKIPAVDPNADTLEINID